MRPPVLLDNRLPRFWGWALLLWLLALTSTAAAQDALRGKRYYLDTARLTGAGVSCVDCHRALPPGLFGIGRAANSPAIVANAINTIPQMAPLRGLLTAADIADLAAFIGNPGVPSPVLQVSTRGPSGGESSDRIDFGTVQQGQNSARGTFRLTNSGALSLQVASNIRIVGPHASEYLLADSGCIAHTELNSGQSCEIGIMFRPSGAAGLRIGAAQIDHDWVGGTAAVALLGTSESSAANPPVTISSGGGGASGGGWAMALACLVASGIRRSRYEYARTAIPSGRHRRSCAVRTVTA